MTQDIIYRLNPATIGKEEYRTLEEATAAANLKIDWGTPIVKIYECRLTKIAKRGETVFELVETSQPIPHPPSPEAPQAQEADSQTE